MKQNCIKMYAQALCCALAVCSTSDFACGMNVMDVKKEKVKDISAETAVSCLQDIDKAASVVWELHNKEGTISESDVYAAFEKVGIPQDEVILDPNELTVPPSGTSFVWISEGRVSTLAMYLCSRICLKLPFENKFTNAVSYEFDQYGKEWKEYSNAEICLAFLDRIICVFCDFYGYLDFYNNRYEPELTKGICQRELDSLTLLWECWANVCFNLESTLEGMY